MFLTPLETDNKQILRRGVYPEHGRRAPQNDIATSPQGDGRQATRPIFEGGREGTKFPLLFPPPRAGEEKGEGRFSQLPKDDRSLSPI
jgi:hypothetical protein